MKRLFCCAMSLLFGFSAFAASSVASSVCSTAFGPPYDLQNLRESLLATTNSWGVSEDEFRAKADQVIGVLHTVGTDDADDLIVEWLDRVMELPIPTSDNLSCRQWGHLKMVVIRSGLRVAKSPSHTNVWLNIAKVSKQLMPTAEDGGVDEDLRERNIHTVQANLLCELRMIVMNRIGKECLPVVPIAERTNIVNRISDLMSLTDAQRKELLAVSGSAGRGL